MLTTTTQLAALPGNVVVPADASGLPHDSVVNVTRVATIDRVALEQRIGILPDWLLAQVDAGLGRAPGLRALIASRATTPWIALRPNTSASDEFTREGASLPS